MEKVIELNALREILQMLFKVVTALFTLTIVDMANHLVYTCSLFDSPLSKFRRIDYDKV